MPESLGMLVTLQAIADSLASIDKHLEVLCAQGMK